MDDFIDCVNRLAYRKAMTEKLNPRSWIQAAFRALSKGGPSAIRAETIARDLNVSKGSFYWHFKNVDDLKFQMLELWQDQATGSIIVDLEATGLSAVEKLKALIDRATSGGNVPYGGLLVEAAIRDWGRYDELVAQRVAKVDRTRLDYLEQLFSEYGIKASNVHSNAAIFYAALIGLEPLAYTGQADVRTELHNLLGILTSQAS